MNISPEVLVVLSTVECNGNRAVLTGQLDRKLYVKTNDVLVALGGKWNSKAKAHLFDGDAAERIDQAIVVGEVTTHKDIGFFPTPPALAEELVRMAKVGPGMVCLEPSAGTGNIVRALVAAGGRVIAVERDLKMRQGLVREFPKVCDVSPIDDFAEMAISAVFSPEVDRVVMNPPFCQVGFSNALGHAQLAYKFLKIGGIEVCVLPSSVLFREDKKHTAFRAWVAEIGGTLTALPALSFRPSGTDVNTCVLFVEKRS
jgi:predicted RNA methylase